MRIVGLEIQKLELTKFLASRNEVELLVYFTDGTAQTMSKLVDLSKPEHSADLLIEEIKKLVINAHKEQITEDISDTNINLVFKEEDRVKSELPGFFSHLSAQLALINKKKDAEGYLDLIRDLKNSKLEFVN